MWMVWLLGLATLSVLAVLASLGFTNEMNRFQQVALPVSHVIFGTLLIWVAMTLRCLWVPLPLACDEGVWRIFLAAGRYRFRRVPSVWLRPRARLSGKPPAVDSSSGYLATSRRGRMAHRGDRHGRVAMGVSMKPDRRERGCPRQLRFLRSAAASSVRSRSDGGTVSSRLAPESAPVGHAAAAGDSGFTSSGIGNIDRRSVVGDYV